MTRKLILNICHITVTVDLHLILELFKPSFLASHWPLKTGFACLSKLFCLFQEGFEKWWLVLHWNDVFHRWFVQRLKTLFENLTLWRIEFLGLHFLTEPQRLWVLRGETWTFQVLIHFQIWYHAFFIVLEGQWIDFHIISGCEPVTIERISWLLKFLVTLICFWTWDHATSGR